MSDPDAQRQASLENWEAAAAGWSRRQALMRDMSAPVSEWMLEALDPQAGTAHPRARRGSRRDGAPRRAARRARPAPC